MSSTNKEIYACPEYLPEPKSQFLLGTPRHCLANYPPWRILPCPYEWYEKLYPLVSNEYSAFAEQAVMKSEVAFAGKANQELKRQEALQWMRHYAVAAGKSPDIQPWVANFLVEWWVARKKGRF